jgi:hypothetical protein
MYAVAVEAAKTVEHPLLAGASALVVNLTSNALPMSFAPPSKVVAKPSAVQKRAPIQTFPFWSWRGSTENIG